jgi:hypothetical protein
MATVLPQNDRSLRDAFGSPLRGKVMQGSLVQLIGRAS